MTLTSEQIQTIDAILEKKGIKYIDIKLELVDHIATQIEQEMITKGADFESALCLVLDKWKRQFVYSSNFFVGIIHSFPKIILNRLASKAKKYFFMSSIITAIWILSINYYKNNIIEILKPFSTIISMSSIVFSTIMLVLIALVNYKSKPTTYRFLVNQSSPILILSLIVIAFDETMVHFQLFYCSLFLIYTFFMIKNYISHKRFIKSIKVIK